MVIYALAETSTKKRLVHVFVLCMCVCVCEYEFKSKRRGRWMLGMEYRTQVQAKKSSGNKTAMCLFDLLSVQLNTFVTSKRDYKWVHQICHIFLEQQQQNHSINFVMCGSIHSTLKLWVSVYEWNENDVNWCLTTTKWVVKNTNKTENNSDQITRVYNRMRLNMTLVVVIRSIEGHNFF